MADLNPFRIETVTRGYDAMFEQMRDAVPSGNFYANSGPVVSYTKDPVLFVLQTDRLNIAVKVQVQRLGDYFDGVDQANLVTETFVVANNYSVSFALTLGKGLNKITAIEDVVDGRTAYFEVTATTNAIFLETYGREFSRAVNLVDKQRRALYSGYSTRLLDQVVNFQDLLPDVQTLKVLSSKMLVRSQVHFPGTEIGNKNLVQSLSLNTPILRPMRTFKPFKIGEGPLLRVNEVSNGTETHMWYPNRAFARWLAFTRMASSMKELYEILDVRDNSVRIKYNGKVQVHRFDMDEVGANFLSNTSGCFNNIEVSMDFFINTNMFMCLWAYPFDEIVQPEAAIGNARTSFDLGIPFDSGLEFDADPVDPFTDGWVGWSLTGRFDHDTLNSNTAQHPLDSHVSPSTAYTGETCSYQGAYTQLLSSFNLEIEVPNDMVVEGEMIDEYIPGALDRLALSLPEGPFTAGVPVLAYAKYADLNEMTVPSGSGEITVKEDVSGMETYVPVVSNGYQAFQLTPTVAGEATLWNLSDGSLTGVSQSREVLPGPIAGISISPIGDFNLSGTFPLEIYAIDAYGNLVTDVGINNKVTINPEPPFAADSALPEYVELYKGKASVVLKMGSVGTGKIKFTLGSASTYSNTFTVFNV